MRLQFDKSGRRFFFLTFCVRGRKAVLSRIVTKMERDGKPGYAVELTPVGEAMAAVFGTILRLPPLKQALASKQFKSVYLDHLLSAQRKEQR